MLVTQHPEKALLKAYSAGELDESLAFIIATHLEMCAECKEHCVEYEEETADQIMTASVRELTASDIAVMEQIMSHTPAPTQPKRRVSSMQTSVNGKTFTLPNTLSAIEPNIGRWDRVIGNLWRASIDVGSDCKMNLIYMENGGGIAEHTHRGFEATLVLDGEFSDESGQFTDGDFILKDGKCIHKPYTDTHCLCLAVMDKPLHFSSGLARLLNPFSHLFF